MASETMREAILEWKNSQRRIMELGKQVEDAQVRKRKACEALAKLIIPPNAQLGENFCIWVRTGEREERLLSVVIRQGPAGSTSSHSYDVSYRGDPRETKGDV